MNTLQSKLFRQSSQYFGGNILLKLIGFVSLPVLTRLLPIEQYGLLSLVSATLFIMVAVSKFGLQHAGVRFYSEFKEEDRLPTFYATLFWGTLLLSLLVGGILSLGCFILGKVVGGVYASPLAYIVIGLTVVNTMLLRISNFFRVEQRINRYNLVNVVQRYSSVILGIILLWFVSRTIDWYLGAFLLVGVMTLFITVWRYFDAARLHPRYFSWSFLRDGLRFGVPLQFMELGNLLIKFSDKYILQILIGISAVGIYAVGSSLSMYVQELIFLPITSAVFPLLMEVHKKEGRAASEAFISEVTNYVWLLAIPVVVGFSLLREDIVLLLASEKFIDTAAIIPVLITGIILWGFCQLYAAGLHIAKKTKTFAYIVTGGALLNIVLNFLLVPVLSIQGAALATVFTFGTLLILVRRVSFQHLNIRTDPTRIAKAGVSALLMGIVISFIRVDELILALLLKILVGVVVYRVALLAIDVQLRAVAGRFLGKYLSSRRPAQHPVENCQTPEQASLPKRSSTGSPFNEFITVLVPIRNEEAHIERCLDSLVNQTYPSDRYEIIVLDGMSGDRTREIVSEFARRHTHLRLLDNPARIVPTALNIGLREGRGDIVIRVDGHAAVEADYLQRCLEALRRTGAECVGGYIDSVNRSFTGKAIALAMSSRFGVGNARFRTNGASGYVDTVAFGAYRREFINRIGSFDEELVRCQDDEFNYRLRKAGGKIFFSPEIRSKYYPRSGLKKLWRQYWGYGLWKVRVLQKHPSMMQLRQFIPPAFVTVLLLAVLAGFFFPVWGWSALLLILGAYCAGSFLAAFRIARSRGWAYLKLLPLIFPILHLSYGAGFLYGLLKFAGRWGEAVSGKNGAVIRPGAANKVVTSTEPRE